MATLATLCLMLIAEGIITGVQTAASPGNVNDTSEANTTDSGYAPSWSFYGVNGPANWTRIGYENCTGSSQSPIAINSTAAIDGNFESFQLTGYDVDAVSDRYYNWIMLNDGHGVVIVMNLTEHPSMAGGGLPSQYTLHSFHWHFGSQDGVGAEHYIDGKQYEMEMHLVHYAGNGSLFDVWGNPKGLAVLGIMFQVGGQDNPKYEPIIKYLQNVTYKGDEIMVPTFSLRDLLPDNVEDFFRYDGSLTTPPCYQTVVWTVFKDPVNISDAQMNAFRKLRTGTDNTSHPMEDNRRPLQALNTRTVYKKQKAAPTTTIATTLGATPCKTNSPMPSAAITVHTATSSMSSLFNSVSMIFVCLVISKLKMVL